MSAHPPRAADPLTLTWLAQLVGTMIIAVVVYLYVSSAGAPFGNASEQWRRYVLGAGMLSIIPALLYMRTYKPVLDKYLRSLKGQNPDPMLRTAAASKLAIGGALSEIPLAFGAAFLMMGGEPRWFFCAVMVSLALRTSYRPFERK